MKRLLTRLLSLLLIVCTLGFTFPQSVSVQAAKIVEGKRSITDYVDEMKIIFYDFKLTKIKTKTKTSEGLNYYYKATYSPKNSNKTKTVKLYKPKMSFSSFTKKFGFTSKLCITKGFTITTETKIANTIIAAFVMGFLTSGTSWVVGSAVGVGASFLDQSLPPGKYKKAVIRTEIKYPEYKGSSTYKYQSFICEYRVLQYNNYDENWSTYSAVRIGDEPMYEYVHWKSYLY